MHYTLNIIGIGGRYRTFLFVCQKLPPKNEMTFIRDKITSVMHIIIILLIYFDLEWCNIQGVKKGYYSMIFFQAFVLPKNTQCFAHMQRHPKQGNFGIWILFSILTKIANIGLKSLKPAFFFPNPYPVSISLKAFPRIPYKTPETQNRLV